MVGNFMREFRAGSVADVKREAWNVSSGKPDWMRRIVYGRIMEKLESHGWKEAKQKAEKVLAEMKGGWL